MKNYRLETAKVVGTATEQAWSQVHLFSPTESEKEKKRGQLLAVLSFKGLDPGVEAVAAGREIIARLHEEYYGQLEKSPFTSLKQAVSKVCREVNLEAAIEIGAAAVVGQVLYLVFQGQGRVLLQRQGQTGCLLKGAKTTTTASGFLKPGDFLLLGTKTFFKKVSPEDLKTALKAITPLEASETLAPIIHGQSKSGTAAAVFFKVKTKTVRATPPGQASRPEVLEKPSSLKPIKEKKRRPFRQGGLIFLGQIKNFFNRNLNNLEARLEKKAVYLKKEKFKAGEKSRPVRSKKTVFTVVLVLFFLLFMSVYLGGQQKKHRETQSEAAVLLTQAQSKHKEAKALAELNPARARELLSEAAALAVQIEAQNYQGKDFLTFKNELEKTQNLILKERQVKAENFYNLNLIKPEAKIDDFTFSGDKLIILDQAKPSIYEVSLDRKNKVLAGGSNFEGARIICASLPQIYVPVKNGIRQVNSLSGKEALILKAEENWSSALDLASWNGNLYLLDSQGLWWFPATPDGVGEKRSWLKEEVDLKNAAALAIDGSIWVLKKDGTLWKFTRGQKEPFGLAGLPEKLTKAKSLYTNENLEKLFLLTETPSQVIVANKTGEYQTSYLFSLPEGEKETIQNLAVNEEKIFLIGQTKIYTFNL